MQYLVSVITDSTTLATEEEQAAITAYNKQLQADGYWVFAGGLTNPDLATVIDNRGEQPLVTDGPFLESKEFIIGFWILDAPDLDVAMKLATGASRACNRRLEVRAFL